MSSWRGARSGGLRRSSSPRARSATNRIARCWGRSKTRTRRCCISISRQFPSSLVSATNLSSRLIPLLLARRRPALVVIALVTALLGSQALALRIDPGVEAMIPVGGDDLKGLRTLQAAFGSDEVVVLAFHSDNLFSRESLARLDRLTRRVAALPHVARVLSPTNVRDLEGDELGPVPLVPYAEVVAGELRPEALGERLAAHPIFGGLLVAKDARTAAILVE